MVAAADSAGDGGDDTAAVRALWTAKADAWTGWADTMAAMAERFNRPLLEATGIAPGQRVLDLAAGAGEPALTAAEMVGPDGLVLASDFVPDMLAGIRRRAGPDAPPALRLVAADMQRLPLADAAFDRATCRFGIMFVPDAAAALREVYRTLAPGGTAGFMVWGPRADQTLFTVLGDAVAEVRDAPLDADHHRIFRFGEPGALPALCEAAGFADIAETPLHFTPTAPADRPFWRPQLDMSFGHVLEGEPEPVRAAVEARIREKLAPLLTADGDGYRMQAHIRIVTARRPA